MTTKTTIPRGEERWVKVRGVVKGTFWKGIYQFQGTIFRVANSVVLGVPEWDEIKDAADRLEMVEGTALLRSCSGDDARSTASVRSTKNGPRVFIPLRIWTEGA